MKSVVAGEEEKPIIMIARSETFKLKKTQTEENSIRQIVCPNYNFEKRKKKKKHRTNFNSKVVKNFFYSDVIGTKKGNMTHQFLNNS